MILEHGFIMSEVILLMMEIVRMMRKKWGRDLSQIETHVNSV
jgi:hypothetical protein